VDDLIADLERSDITKETNGFYKSDEYKRRSEKVLYEKPNLDWLATELEVFDKVRSKSFDFQTAISQTLRSDGQGLKIAIALPTTDDKFLFHVLCRSCTLKKWGKYEMQKRNQRVHHGARRQKRNAQGSLPPNYQTISYPTRHVSNRDV